MSVGQIRFCNYEETFSNICSTLFEFITWRWLCFLLRSLHFHYIYQQYFVLSITQTLIFSFQNIFICFTLRNGSPKKISPFSTVCCSINNSNFSIFFLKLFFLFYTKKRLTNKDFPLFKKKERLETLKEFCCVVP